MNAMALISPIATRAHATHTHTVRATMSRTNTSRAHAVSLTVTSLIVLLGTANLIDVYGTVTLWLSAAAPATVIGALIAAMGIRERLRGWWQMLALAIAQCLVGPLVALPHTAIFRVFPSIATLREGWSATFSSFKLIVSMTPPIGAVSGSLMAMWSICLWSSALAGMFAILPNSRFCILSATVSIADCALCALLGTHNATHRALLGVTLAILILCWLSWRWQLLEYSRLPTAVLILLLTAMIAVGYCSTVHVQRVILRDYYDPPLSLQQYSSPLSGMRAYIKEHKEDALLTVRNLPAGASVRLAVMDWYDGNVWNLTDEQSHTSSGRYVRASTTITPPEEQHNGEIFQASFTVHDGMRDYWLPLAGSATQVVFEDEHDRSRDDFFYNQSANSGILTSGIHVRLSYSETGLLATQLSEEQIRHANAANIEQAAIHDIPEAVSSMALALAGGQNTAGAQALALANGLREHGWFSHGLANDYPSNSGHGNYRLTQLLGGAVMVGDSEQYASAMALMARSLGLPSRVVLGFVPKDSNGDPTATRTERMADGQMTVTFTGNDICAWVEILLEDYGWVAFYPTPQETKIPDEDENLTPPNPETLVRQPPPPLTDPLRDEQQPANGADVSGEDAEEPSTPSAWHTVAQVLRTIAVVGSPLWAMLLICGIILIVKAIQLVRMRSHGSANMRVEAGWRSITLLARQSGMRITGTRSEQGAVIAQTLCVGERTLHQAAYMADYAAFSGESLSNADANAYWESADAIREAILHMLPVWQRVRVRLDLRGVFRGHTNSWCQLVHRQLNNATMTASAPTCQRHRRRGAALHK